MKSLATWCVRHRVIVLLLWLAALVGMTLHLPVGGHRLLQQLLPAQHRPRPRRSTCCRRRRRAIAGDREQIVFHTTDGTKVTDPEVHGHRQHHAGQGEGGAPRHRHHQPLRAARRHPDQQGRDDRLRHGELRPARPRTSPPRWPNSWCPRPRRPNGPDLQVAVAGQVAEAADKQSFGGTGLGVHPGRDRPVPGVRLGLRHGPPPVVGPGLPGHGHRAHRAARATCSRCRSSRPSWSCSSGSGWASTTPCSS